uniref:Chemokine interleukin-8-like domain-containing protein n=1 Tax=Macaca fascicularis TaxID=9541 RepID=A0A7N9CH28_MACFA
MAGPMTIVTSLLFLGVCAHHIIPTGSVVIPSSCCMSFLSKRIPENRVVSYQLSNRSTCLSMGVMWVSFMGMWQERGWGRYNSSVPEKQGQPALALCIPGEVTSPLWSSTSLPIKLEGGYIYFLISFISFFWGGGDRVFLCHPS